MNENLGWDGVVGSVVCALGGLVLYRIILHLFNIPVGGIFSWPQAVGCGIGIVVLYLLGIFD